MLEGPIAYILYLSVAAYVARKAMRYYMTSTVWHCHEGFSESDCRDYKNRGHVIHKDCYLVERGEIEPRDGTAVRYAAVVAAFWPFWVLVYGVSTWIRKAPYTDAEKQRIVRENDAKIERQKKEIEALEAKIQEYHKQ